MMLLPKKVGPLTLTRKLGSDGVTESYLGILDEPAGRQVAVRRLLPWLVRDRQKLATVEARIGDLLRIRDPRLVPVLDHIVSDEPDGPGHYVVEAFPDTVDLEQVLAWCLRNGQTLPPDVLLAFACEICSALDALHELPAQLSGGEHVLHLGLRPSAIHVTTEGEVLLGEPGLLRSAASIPPEGLSAAFRRPDHLSPEQTHPDQPLGPPSDLFALGALLYELLTLRPMFRAESNLQTLHRIRRAEVTAQLLEVKELFPGLDKVLYRALSLYPRHRYQRAYLMREDLRGLFGQPAPTRLIERVAAFVAPIFADRSIITAELPTRVSLPPRRYHDDSDEITTQRNSMPPTRSMPPSHSLPPSRSQTTWVETSPAEPVRPLRRARRVPSEQPAPAVHTSPPAVLRHARLVGTIGLAGVAAAGLVCAGVGGNLFVNWMRTTPPAELAQTRAMPTESGERASAPAPSLPPEALVQREATPEPSPAAPAPTSAAAPASASPGPVAGSTKPARPTPPPTRTARAFAPPPPSDPPIRQAAIALPREIPTSRPELEASTPLAVTDTELDTWSSDAHAGKLDEVRRTALAAVPPSPAHTYTRARALLYADARARGDLDGRARHLEALMRIPENRYRPEWAVEQADLAIHRRDWQTALDHATFAERHWARLPSDLIFTRMASTYEILASAHMGLFYASDGTDLPHLEAALRAWERYRRHVSAGRRGDLVSKADQQLAKLQDVQRLLE